MQIEVFQLKYFRIKTIVKTILSISKIFFAFLIYINCERISFFFAFIVKSIKDVII